MGTEEELIKCFEANSGLLTKKQLESMRISKSLLEKLRKSKKMGELPGIYINLMEKSLIDYTLLKKD